MAYRGPEPPPETVQAALTSLRSEDLRLLLGVSPVPKPYPTRKADMAVALDKQMSGKALHMLWNALNPMQQAAVAEAVHDMHGRFNAQQFEAKYGDMPQGYRLKDYRETSLLRLFALPLRALRQLRHPCLWTSGYPSTSSGVTCRQPTTTSR